MLSETHPVGPHKAAFLRSLGFSASRWQELRWALLDHACRNDVARVEETPFGTKLVVEGRLHGPGGRSGPVRVVWFLEATTKGPRLVTV